jgi:hypothetical protein
MKKTKKMQNHLQKVAEYTIIKERAICMMQYLRIFDSKTPRRTIHAIQ